MKKAPIIAANWKMYKSGKDAQEFLELLYKRLPDPKAMVLIAPSFTALPFSALVVEEMPYILGAQNMHESDEGAFTGEVSASMIKEVGASFVILGHSERRRLFNETDSVIHLKLKKAFEKGLLPILCVGEAEEEKSLSKTCEILTDQISLAIGDCFPEELVIAYEPVWAIGSKKAASCKKIEEIHAFCRSVVAGLWGAVAMEKVSIIYGGSVTPQKAPSLAASPNVDGVLVGRASLDVDEFLQIIQRFSL
jgi:triosephosphate isomerase (TIM)